MEVKILAFDGQGRQTTKEVTGVATVLATQVTDMTALLADLDDISGLGRTGYNMTAKQASALAGEGVTSNKDEAFHLRYALADGSIFNQRIPSPKKTAGVFDFISGGVVDIANAAVVAWAANFMSGGQFRLKPGVAATSVIDGYLES